MSSRPSPSVLASPDPLDIGRRDNSAAPFSSQVEPAVAGGLVSYPVAALARLDCILALTASMAREPPVTFSLLTYIATDAATAARSSRKRLCARLQGAPAVISG